MADSRFDGENVQGVPEKTVLPIAKNLLETAGCVERIQEQIWSLDFSKNKPIKLCKLINLHNVIKRSSEVNMKTNSWELVNRVKETSIYPVFSIRIVPLGNPIINKGKKFFIKEVKLKIKKKGKKIK